MVGVALAGAATVGSTVASGSGARTVTSGPGGLIVCLGSHAGTMDRVTTTEAASLLFMVGSYITSTRQSFGRSSFGEMKPIGERLAVISTKK
jgi:hypothetical protein